VSTTGYLVLAMVIVVIAIAGYAASLEARKRKLEARLTHLDPDHH
jgi:CcmD family protein